MANQHLDHLASVASPAFLHDKVVVWVQRMHILLSMDGGDI